MSVEHRTVTALGARKAITKCFNKKRPMFLWGPPGIGKSEVVADITQHWPAILISVLMINLLIFWIARSSYQLIARLYQATKNHIYMVILIIIVIITIFFGGKYDDGLLLS